jgi:hypothetical protein
MEFQNLFGIGIKCFLTGILLPAILVPDATMAPVGGNTAFRRHPCAGKKDDVLILPRINGFHLLKPQGRDYHDHSCLTITNTKVYIGSLEQFVEYGMKGKKA